MRFIKYVLLFFAVSFVLFVSLLAVTYNLIPKIETPVSILILGKGGEGHTAPNLTDTIIVGYLNTKLKKTSIVSLPRDIWIPEIRAKLNTAYHYGGFEMAKNSVTSITGQQINYTAVIDFSLFKDLIDSIGGIDVVVENDFIDEKYPIEDKENDLCNGDKLFKCRYETIQFTQGKQKMDGELALRFVRSRNADGDEGTDLAREKRQQKVIEAVKEKLLSTDVILNPNTIKKIYDMAISHTETDINIKDGLSIVRFMFESRENISFSSIPEDMLIVSQNDKKYDRQYVFLPASGRWKEVQEWLSKNI
ncbi:MAG: LCP family protein [Patescibacteria group bacterium]